MNIINETLARRNKENYSFSDYIPGSATEEYNQQVAETTEQIEKAKLRVSYEGKIKLERLLNSYKINLGNWINKSNANGANHVSVMIAGPANYNMRAHEKYVSRENALMAEYDNIHDIEEKIYSIVHGDKIIKASDPNALEKLKEKLLKAQEEHQGYKDYNIKARKEKTASLQPYVLQNSNARIKAIKARITKLERLAVKTTEETIPATETELNGIKIVDNVEANRLQIIFEGKPSAAVRGTLKKHGFKWAPSNMAWQRFRSDEAIRIAKKIISEIVA